MHNRVLLTIGPCRTADFKKLFILPNWNFSKSWLVVYLFLISIWDLPSYRKYKQWFFNDVFSSTINQAGQNITCKGGDMNSPSPRRDVNLHAINWSPWSPWSPPWDLTTLEQHFRFPLCSNANQKCGSGCVFGNPYSNFSPILLRKIWTWNGREVPEMEGEIPGRSVERKHHLLSH